MSRSCLYAVFLGAAAATGCGSHPNTESIGVGHIAPLSGPDRLVGEHARQGIQLALEDVNDESRRIAGQKVAVIHADSKGDSGDVLAQASRLVAVNKATALLGVSDAATADRLARAVEPYGVPLVLADSPAAPPAGEMAVSVAITPAQQGQALARWAVRERRVGKIIVLVDGRLGLPAAVAAAFVREFPQDAGHRLEQWPYETTARFTELVGRLPRAGAEAVLFAGAPGDLPALRTALRTADTKTEVLYAGDEVAVPVLLADHDAATALILATSYLYLPDEPTPQGKAFARRYLDRFKEGPDVNAALAYESAQLLFEAMRKAGKTEASAVRKAVADLEGYDGLTGRVTLKGRVPRRTVFVARAENGRLKMEARFTPEGP